MKAIEAPQIPFDVQWTESMESEIRIILAAHRFASHGEMDTPQALTRTAFRERDRATATINAILVALQRGQAPTLDCDIMNRVARISEKVSNQNNPNEPARR